MMVRLTLYYRDGHETSRVYTMARAFRLAQKAQDGGRITGFVLETER